MGLSDADLRMGVQVLDYARRLTEVVAVLSSASVTAHAAVDVLATGDAYRGRALPELQMLFSGYAANADKLACFHQVASRYLGKVFEEFARTNEDLAAIVLAWGSR